MQRIKSALKYDDYFANATLAAEWDIVNEIVINMRAMDHPPHLQHIRSHQDKNKPIQDLSLSMPNSIATPTNWQMNFSGNKTQRKIVPE